MMETDDFDGYVYAFMMRDVAARRDYTTTQRVVVRRMSGTTLLATVARKQRSQFDKR